MNVILEPWCTDSLEGLVLEAVRIAEKLNSPVIIRYPKFKNFDLMIMLQYSTKEKRPFFS